MDLFAAVDWAWNTSQGGQSFTILAIGTYYHGRIKIMFVRRFQGSRYHDPDVVLNEISSIVNKLQVKVVGTDFGIGHKENLRLKTMVVAKVFEMMYTNQNRESYFDWPSRCYKLSRTMTLDLVFMRLKKRLYQFPRQEIIAPYAADLLNIYTEYDPNWKKVKYEHADTGPDDFAHLLNYLAVIMENYYGIKIR